METISRSITEHTVFDLKELVEEINMVIDLQGDWGIGRIDSDNVRLSEVAERLNIVVLQLEAEELIERSTNLA